MEKQTLVTPEMESMVGSETVFSSPEELGRATIRRFALAVGDPNPLYWDEEFANKTQYDGIIAPPTMIFELNHNLADEISEDDGGYSDKVLLPPPLTRFVRGGNEYEFFQAVRPTDKITVKRKISQIFEKEGKGGALVFVIIELTYTNQHGELLGINRETFIFMPDKAS
jgi:acyl dehydratase